MSLFKVVHHIMSAYVFLFKIRMCTCSTEETEFRVRVHCPCNVMERKEFSLGSLSFKNLAFADPNIFKDEFLFPSLLSGQTMSSKNEIFKNVAAAACLAQLKWVVFVAAVTRF